MSRLLIISIASFMVFSSALFGQKLSDQAQLSVITCGNGTEIYSLFGHSAVRVFDPDQRIDQVYNYGTFDFEKPGFEINFLRGKLLYNLSVSSYDGFLQGYYNKKRYVREQVLNLSFEERQLLFDALLENARPENRDYQYDFFYDNCTTRIRDLLANVLDQVAYPTQSDHHTTYRQLLHENLGPYPWTQFGMDLILGETTDLKADVQGQMFLPAYFMNYLESTKKANNPLVLDTASILEFPDTEQKKGLITPDILFFGLVVIELVFFFLFYVSGDDRLIHQLDKLWFGVLLVCSVIFIFMWLGTDHEVCSYNWNLLWTVPWMIFCLNDSIRTRWQNILILLTIILSIILLCFWKLLPQQLPTAVIFITLITLIKSIRLLGIKSLIDKYVYRHHMRDVANIAACICLFCSFGLSQEKIGGITLVAPPREHTEDPMVELIQVNTTWVALVPYGFSQKGSPEVQFGSSRQWWGERIEGIKNSIDLAHASGLKVMLKPQVWIRGGWVGDVDFETEADWIIWQDTYRAYIMSFVKVAIDHNVDMICIGTEYRISATKREAFWRSLISEIRKDYKGKLVYSSNWDSYDEVPFWDALDFVGISAYFPLTDMDTPIQMYLSFKWKSIVSKLKKFSLKFNKKILFTEYGYLSVDGAAGRTWELEKQVKQLNINEKAQANSLEALYEAFWKEDFWAGGFLWKWFPNGHGHEGYPERDYTPQGKMAESVVKKWYSKAK